MCTCSKHHTIETLKIFYKIQFPDYGYQCCIFITQHLLYLAHNIIILNKYQDVMGCVTEICSLSLQIDISSDEHESIHISWYS